MQLLERLTPRTRAVAALVLSVPLIVGVHVVLLWWLPFDSIRSLGIDGQMFGNLVVSALCTIAAVLLLLLGARGRMGLKATLFLWFGAGRGRGLLLGLALTLPLYLVMFLLHGSGPFRGPASMTLTFSLYGILVAPFVEEILFRGFLFGLLHREVRANAWGALVLSSLLFAIAHLTPDGVDSLLGWGLALLRLGVGAFLCWAYWRRGEDLWFPIGFHAGVNLCGSFLHSPGGRAAEWFALTYQYAEILTMALAYVALRILEGRKAASTTG